MTATTVRAGGIAMIGGGRMASALAEGFCRAGLLSPAEIVVHDPSPAAREALVARVPGVRLAATPAEAAGAAEIVWLAVKPQQAAAACGGITDVMPGRTLVSILAGLTTATLAKLAGTPRVIRVMPNTPCLVGRGVSVACRTPEVLDAVTAVSGSGPGFLALIVEALAAGGERAGLPRPLALSLAVETLAGTGALLERTGEEPAVIRERVSSPGGTTLAGLAVLTERGVPEAFIAAIEAAAARAAELGR